MTEEEKLRKRLEQVTPEYRLEWLVGEVLIARERERGAERRAEQARTEAQWRQIPAK